MLTPVIALAVLIVSALWVYRDATVREARGRPVTVTLGTLRIQTPAAWGLACLLLWIFFVPLYLTGRNQA